MSYDPSVASYSSPLNDPAANFNSAYYTYAYPGDTVTATTFKITATAKGSQVDDTSCTPLTLEKTLDKDGVKCPGIDSSCVTNADCWKK